LYLLKATNVNRKEKNKQKEKKKRRKTPWFTLELLPNNYINKLIRERKRGRDRLKG